MKLKLSLTALLTAATFAQAEVRTWTSADDATKKFEGELLSSAADKVTIKLKTGKSLTFPLTKLAKEDQEFVAKDIATKTADAKAAEAAGKLKTSVMAKELKGKTVSLQGKGLKKHDVFEKKAPEYFLVYWGASW